MKFTIIQIRSMEVYDHTSKKTIFYLGWAFIDCKGKTIIQCYGNSKRDLIKEML